ncbi:tRNA methyltransferase [Solemya pervernicosa gill symbiont]|uniref:tRNA methyltransferase n=1 Tax=Solemya pervernicosa gill symbiont TaxID=642797 RepID=A0A1T2LA72_9GAMM|nr:sulfurtransferase TusA family protein [Solemya pervernicosa gill symbiont]OOZ41944.1 tRNA methyltransferase [Solemya pervernicosa gill symbiont]
MEDDQNIELDIRGQICPSCLLLALKEINNHVEQLKSGACTINIISDDRQAVATIPDTVKNMGLTTEINKDDGSYQIRIFKA